MYKSPPHTERTALLTICTALFVIDIVKPESPSPNIFIVLLKLGIRQSFSIFIIVFLPVRNVKVHKAAINCEIIVASAAPLTPIPRMKINTGSRIRLHAAPIDTVSIPVLANPCALIKELRPRLDITKIVPQRYIVIY